MIRHQITLAFEGPSQRLVCATCRRPVGTVAFLVGAIGPAEGRVVSFLRHYGPRR